MTYQTKCSAIAECFSRLVVVAGLLGFAAISVTAAPPAVTARPVVVLPAAVQAVKPKQVRGTVDINCNEKEAKVFVNGNPVGNTEPSNGFPRKLKLQPGTYSVRVEFGDQMLTQRVEVTAGREVAFNVKF